MLVVKVGGGKAIDLEAVSSDLVALRSSGEEIVLIHGGAETTNEIATALGHPPRFVESESGMTSRRTDRRTLDIFTMVYAGLLNKRWVASLQRLGVDAVGLSGVDGRLLEGQRKPNLRIREGGRRMVLRDDFTGRVDRVNVDLLRLLLDRGYLPVVTPPAISNSSEIINVDGDRAAARIAAAMAADRLVILSNVAGLLERFPDESTLVSHIPRSQIERYLDLAEGRMKKKILGASEALQGGVTRVILGDGRRDHPITTALAGGGTHLHQEGALKSTTEKTQGPVTQKKTQWGIELTDSAQPETEPEAFERHLTRLMPARPTRPLVRGQGSLLFDDSDQPYLDLTSGYGTALLGHAHPEVTRAISEQAERLISCPGNLLSDTRNRLLLKLAALLPNHLNRFFLCNSGTEAVEAALKFALLSTGRERILAFKGSFHGRTLGALSATWSPIGRRPFQPWLIPARFVDPIGPGTLEALEETVDERTAAVVLEVIQGEGGVRPLEPALLRRVKQLCRERGALLIIDEIQTGCGRTGTFLSHVAGDLDLEADLVTLAKGIANGVPVGVVAMTDRVAEALEPGVHGSTFGGNPLACAAAIATLEILERDDLADRAGQIGGAFLARLEQALGASRQVRAIRGRGLMIGIELRQRAARMLRRLLLEHRILALSAGATVVRFLPPLTVEEDQLDTAVSALAEILA